MEGELLSPYEGRRYGWGEESRKKMFIRNIQTGPRSMALYRRVAVLPCVEGQKVSKLENIKYFKTLICGQTPCGYLNC